MGPTLVIPLNHIFSFLQVDPVPSTSHRHDIVIHPPSFGVPWPTTFPAARQCRYWKLAILACEELVRDMRALRTQTNKRLPDWFSQSNAADPTSNHKERLLVDTSVSAAIYMAPNSAPERIQIIAQLFLLLWTHDVVDSIMQDLLSLSRKEKPGATLEMVPSLTFGSELLDDCHGLLRVVLAHFCTWVCFTREQQRTNFGDLRDYLDYRASDIAADTVSSCVRWGNRLDLQTAELASVQEVVNLAMDHIILVNDLFSFNREKNAAVEEGALFLNAVHYLEGVLGVHSPLAKDLTMQLVWDFESKVTAKIRHLRQCDRQYSAQWRYLDAMVEAAAGNLFFSLTSVRYGAKRHD
ncbi:hypothetical protein ASPZODRAFT_105738 [Penicilliopsis zonata CBS 506.65]|uniref:Terpene synthase n=1 Tax=Penicilliopsis zonata CBS 506.65 TaxID=1073090 RepID=A0A1L9S4N4_9EURO|nr:hypothetical protein ASPZODRAFT_105738 [Penicilliopsis zonata CBS 506.65]OJJ42124.1 hypothetical protein ASPZODRAFT_105738 [Penicilliopsis zonata CBS 506.65]